MLEVHEPKESLKMDNTLPIATQHQSLIARGAWRVLREIKELFGAESYLKSEDRRILEQCIFPHFLDARGCQDILFVGCNWYSKPYNKIFENKKNYWTIELDASRKRYGARQHIVGALQTLRSHFNPKTFDLIVCNGVFGWGLDAKSDVDKAFRDCGECLREGGVLLIGWNDIDSRRPFPLDQCESLRALRSYVFPPLGTAEYITNTPYRHAFRLYIKQKYGDSAFQKESGTSGGNS